MSEDLVYLSGGTRTARKKHICDLCLTHIHPGWTYSYANLIIGDDGPFTQKSHPACEDAFSQLDLDDRYDFDAIEWRDNGYVWPTYDNDGNVIEMPSKTNCWRCANCGRRGRYQYQCYGVCRQCAETGAEGGA